MTPHPIQDAVLRVDRLSVVYPGGVTALRDTSIAFRRGEFTVLLGLSGAGKSTLAHAVEERLHERIVGQERAIAALADAIRRSRSGLGRGRG